MQDFCNLHVHTTFSIMDSLIKPSELFLKVKELGQSAVAVSDHSTLAAAWDSLKYSKEAGVKLLMGCEFNFVDDLAQPQQERLRHIILIATNAAGYKNLLLANKLANDNFILAFKKVVPRIDWKILEQVSEGLICTTACGGAGILGRLYNTRRPDEAKNQAKKLKDIFGERLAFEIHPHGMKRITNPYNDYEDQSLVNKQLIKLGEELGVRVVPTSNAHYLVPEHHETHDAMLAIGSGQPVKSGQRLKYTNDFYLHSREQMVKFFSRLHGDKIEKFCDNSLYFADMCEKPEWIDPKWSNPSGKELPTFPVKDQPDYELFCKDKDLYSVFNNKNLQEDESYLWWLCDTASKKYSLDNEEYKNRLLMELDVLINRGFSSYILIVADYVNWAKKNNIPVGPGRGSVSGCYIAYLLGIHQADPLKYGLIFERFQNKLKNSYPDIDEDFSKSGKPLIGNYLIKKYGGENVAHISNYSTLTPKPYVKAISRAFQYGGDAKAAVAIGTQIADSISADIESINQAVEKVPLFGEYANSLKYSELIKYKELDGSFYNLSKHAAGMVISTRPIYSIVPLRKDKEGDWTLEYEKERAEANGLIKMDILGLETLDVIKNTYDLINFCGKVPPVEPFDYEGNDSKTYDLISRGDTFCVFQFGESAGTIDLCKRIQPKSIEDLAIITALARPGVPKDFKDQFIEARLSGKKPEYLHSCLERSLGKTYGIPIFDEVMLTLGADVAGWDLNESDRLRKFIKDKGKHPEKDEQLKKDFIASTIKNGIEPAIAKKLWTELFANFNAYLFNKAHSVTYSFISYQTAYLKAHYPLEFLTANLMSEVKSNAKKAADNILQIKDEIKKLNVKILPPDINKSDMTYKIIDDNTLLTGLDSLKFIGKDAIPEIIAKRPFTSFEDFLSKVDGRKVKAPSVLALAASGCLDSFGMTRKQMFLYAADYKKKLALWLKKDKKQPFNYPWVKEEEWTIPERYAMEMFYLGEGLTGNLFQVYPNIFDNQAANFAKLPQQYPEPSDSPVMPSSGIIEGIVKKFFEFKVKKEGSKIKGETMAKMLIQDPWGNGVVVTLFPRSLNHLKQRLKELPGKVKLEPGAVLHISGTVNWYEGNFGILFDDLRKCAPPPAKPADLKPRKVSMKISGSNKKGKAVEPEDILEEIEEELIEEGTMNDSFIEELDSEMLEFEDDFPDAFS